MKKKESEGNRFLKLLKHYIDIKGLDIVVYLKNGMTVELNKNRVLEKNQIIMFDRHNREIRINIDDVQSVDMFAA
jgi:hypothetical protein